MNQAVITKQETVTELPITPIKAVGTASVLKEGGIAPWLLLAGALLLVYARVLVDLAGEWWNNPDYSHGLVVPFAIGWILWQKKDVLKRLPLKPSAWGIPIIVGSQFVYLVGLLGSEFFLQRFSLVILFSGVVLLLLGWRFFWTTVFAPVLLAMAIPLPAIVFNAIAIPLQLLASSWAEATLRVCQIPVFRDGNVLQLSNQMLNVSEACSGIRSLMSLLTLGVMMVCIVPLRSWLRVLFVLSAVPIALVFNSARVAGTGVLAQHFGEKAATGFFHTFSGWVMFVLAFGVLLLELSLFRSLDGHERERA